MNQDKENLGISLLKKGQKGLVHAIFSRLGIFLVLLVLQVAMLFTVFRWFEDFLPHIYGGAVLFTVFMVLYLLNTRIDPSAKLTWLVLIMLMPVFGALLFLYTQRDIGHRALKARAHHLMQDTRCSISQDPETAAALEQENPGAASLATYVGRSGAFPVYRNSEVTYFPIGEAKFEEMKIQLEKAEKFIFLEYFIVDEGKMWGQILDILARKASQGVDVRVMYDGTCELSTLPHDYPRRLEALGIRCKMFAPITPFVSTHYNYRDHRKILVIDGHTAFNGGVNLADEYINAYVKYGHWKDTAVMIQGDAVRSFTLMFLQMWSMDEKEPVFDPYLRADTVPQTQAHGFVMPYGDCPVDDDKVGEHVYIDILNRARRYVHIMTPYLILDGEMEDALKFAAKRGVDVRLILPGIPDKALAYALAYTHYRALLDAGVRIYEYTPGFVHAKVFVADDREAVVGTINLDYRSLYHHFECATYMTGVRCISEIEADFQQTQLRCRTVTDDSVRHEKFSRKASGFLMKAIAPLL